MTATTEPNAGPYPFPPGFRWGVATAAYQVEGAAREDGRGPSIWDVFSHTPGRVRGGDTGDVAADHYHRYREDVALLAELGVGTYRFSVAWPRIQPHGHGSPEPRGLAFYSRLVDTLLEAGIAPMVTLYHWDLPQALQEAGGWAARDTAYRFAEYAEIVYRTLADRVSLWTTLNEPWCTAFLGYGAGVHAPGRTAPGEALAAVHHLLLGHGLAVRAMRAVNDSGQQHSIVLNLAPVRADGGNAGEPFRARDAVRRVDGLQNRLLLDPLLKGSYPEDVLDDTAAITDWNCLRPGDDRVIAAPLDLLGVNYYAPIRVTAESTGTESGADAFPGCDDVRFLPGPGPLTDMGWEIEPTGLRDILCRVARDYPAPPLLVTENGAAFPDVVEDGRVCDRERVAYLRDHVLAAQEAITAGVDLRGYLAWSLLDNFEWAEGYARRFGLVHVDFGSQRRTLKDSGHWFRCLIERNAVPPGPGDSLYQHEGRVQ